MCVHSWPEVISSLSRELQRSSALSGMKANKSSFSSHVVSMFLHDLCHRFSVYYNRVHILPGSVVPKHLMGVLHARILLLQAIKNTMDTAFYLLNVRPFAQM